MERLHSVSVRIEAFVRLVVITIMVFMLCAVLLDVLARNTSIRVRGLDELARYSLIWVVFLVTGVSARYGDLLGMEALADILPTRARTAVWFLRRLLILVFLAFFAWYALGLVGLMLRTGRNSPNLHIPLWFVYAPIVLGSVLMFVSLVVDLLVRMARGTVGAAPDHDEGRLLWN